MEAAIMRHRHHNAHTSRRIGRQPPDDPLRTLRHTADAEPWPPLRIERATDLLQRAAVRMFLAAPYSQRLRFLSGKPLNEVRDALKVAEIAAAAEKSRQG
jgi:hypothetical protein